MWTTDCDRKRASLYEAVLKLETIGWKDKVGVPRVYSINKLNSVKILQIKKINNVPGNSDKVYLQFLNYTQMQNLAKLTVNSKKEKEKYLETF